MRLQNNLHTNYQLAKSNQTADLKKNGFNHKLGSSQSDSVSFGSGASKMAGFLAILTLFTGCAEKSANKIGAELTRADSLSLYSDSILSTSKRLTKHYLNCDNYNAIATKYNNKFRKNPANKSLLDSAKKYTNKLKFEVKTAKQLTANRNHYRNVKASLQKSK